jgi:thioesterase domain-containing protein
MTSPPHCTGLDISGGAESGQDCSWVWQLRDGSRAPLFCACAAGGDPLDYRDLAEALPDGVPVYAFGLPGLEGGQFPTVESLAGTYLAKIRQIQKAGPYYLSGHSFGGLAVYEIATRLAETGETVALLALFDTELPGYTHTLSKEQRRTFKRIYLLNRIGKYSQNVLKARVGKIAWDAWALCRRALKWLFWPAVRAVFRRLERPLPGPIRSNQLILTSAWCGYTPSRYPGRLVLFYASERTPEYKVEPTLGWKNCARGGVEIAYVSGNHLTMLHPPHLSSLAAAIIPLLSVPAGTVAACR